VPLTARDVVRTLVLRGVAAGALAGLIAFVFARIFAEPVIQAAIDYEGQRDEVQQKLEAAAGIPAGPEEAELFSRVLQGNLGIGLGMLLFGAGLGALFAVAFCLCWGRFGRLRPRTLAMLLALGGFVTLYLVPFLKYPANPPAVGNHETIQARSGLYLIMVLGSVIAALFAVWLGRRLVERLGQWNATLVGILGFLVVTGLLMAVLPAFGELASDVAQYGPHMTETPREIRDGQGAILLGGFDADLLYQFRLYSVGAALLLWTVLGLAFAPLAERVLSSERGERYFEPVSG
jgi:uncharacterized membrane protein